jgi:hypothetical protein
VAAEADVVTVAEVTHLAVNPKGKSVTVQAADLKETAAKGVVTASVAKAAEGANVLDHH